MYGSQGGELDEFARIEHGQPFLVASRAWRRSCPHRQQRPWLRSHAALAARQVRRAADRAAVVRTEGDLSVTGARETGHRRSSAAAGSARVCV